MIETPICRDITPSDTLGCLFPNQPDRPVAHAIDTLGFEHWFYLAQVAHDFDDQQNRIKIQACELKTGIWHTLLDSSLNQEPLQTQEPVQISGQELVETTCDIAILDAGDSRKSRLCLKVITPNLETYFLSIDNLPVGQFSEINVKDHAECASAFYYASCLHCRDRTLLVGREQRSVGHINRLIDVTAQLSPLDGEIVLDTDPLNLLDLLEQSKNHAVNHVVSFSGALYVSIEDIQLGCSIWSTSPAAEPIRWRPIFEQGAERYAQNMQVFSCVVHRGSLFLVAGTSIDARYPVSGFFDYQGFELLRIDPDDHWELLFGVPRFSVSGLKLPLSALGPSLGDRKAREWLFLHSQNDHLLMGTSDNEGLQLSFSRNGIDWQHMTRDGFERLDQVKTCKAIACGDDDIVLLAENVDFNLTESIRFVHISNTAFSI
ncbi:hypothetical protein [Thiorhodovibrio frisius]|uniref:Uncharacterized protein n=1 Tax=Thiorhodovibrio frisius TaxID=631362 RepID=H8YZW9_9GAMM|nr:hypothetical protein [Thiorhodovibrio frisius]EIC22246.1 hypothetical protein Thi970DRAFT_02499 [Thiorhodovibrio frisius]WPL24541.1 hypothetical protein Thiofri_04761 [Thiorhodovibrio frisius]